MRRSTVKSGLRLVIGGVISVILATFFHRDIATLLDISSGGEQRLIYLGLFWGGILGFCGIIVTMLGFVRAPILGGRDKLFPELALLILLILLFIALLFFYIKSSEQPRLRPGETITI